MLRRLVGTTALALGLGVAASAHASFINGSISFNDGFDVTATTTSIVSQMTSIDVGGTSNASGCTADFGAGCASSSNYAQDFDLSALGGQIVFLYDGFTFVVSDFSSIVRTGLNCDRMGNCADGLSFTGTGSVTGGTFDETAFTMSWSATAGCAQNSIASPIQCAPGTITAHWIATVSALGKGPDDPVVGPQPPLPTPEPGSLALVGLALGAAGWRVRGRSAA